MNTIKKSLAIILSIMILCSSFATAFAVDDISGIYKHSKWTLDSLGKLTIEYTDEQKMEVNEEGEPYLDDEGNPYYDYYYESPFDDPSNVSKIKKVEIAEGVKELELPLAVLTNIDEISIPASLDFGMPEGVTLENYLADFDVEINNALKELNITLDDDTISFVKTVVITVALEIGSSFYSNLPLTAVKYTVAAANPVLKSENNNLYSKDGSVLFRQSKNNKNITLGTVPFVDPVALAGISNATITITDDYAAALYGIQDEAVAVLRYVSEEIGSDSLEGEIFSDIIPAVEEIVDFIFTLELSLCSAKEFVVSDTNEYLKTIDGVLYSKDLTSLIKYPVKKSGKKFYIPESVDTFTIPFVTIDIVSALECVLGVTTAENTEEAILDIDVEETFNDIIVTPKLEVYLKGEQFDKYSGCNSQIDMVLYKYITMLLDQYIGGMLPDVFGDFADEVIPTATKTALALVKTIGISKIIVDGIPENAQKGVYIYNGVMDILHSIPDIIRSFADGDKKKIGESIKGLLRNDLLKDFAGEENIEKYCLLVDAILTGDFDLFMANVSSVFVIVDKVIDYVDLDEDEKKAALDTIECIKAFLSDTSYDNWCAVNKSMLDNGMIDEDQYQENITKEYYDSIINTMRAQFNEIISEIDEIIVAIKDPDNAEAIKIIKFVADVIEAVTGVFPSEIIEGAYDNPGEEGHAHKAGEPVKKDSYSDCALGGIEYTLTYCTICGKELSRETKDLPAKAHDYSPWKFSEDGTTRTRRCYRCGKVEQFYFTFHCPSVVTTPSFEAYGVANPGSSIVISEGEAQLAKATADSNGKWSASVTLRNPASPSNHNITATYTSGKDTLSEEKTVRYDKDAIYPVEFTLSHNTWGTGVGYYDTTLDLLHVKQTHFTIVPSHPMHFRVKLNKNDNVESLKITSTKGNEVKSIKGEYDAKTGAWNADGFFDPSNGSYIPGDIKIVIKLKNETKEIVLDIEITIIIWLLDPSGFVYEAVKSNKVENATATVFYLDGSTERKWDANVSEQDNPQKTDVYGVYHWDVPEGKWRVMVEKEGYETSYSEWMKVPPEWTEVAIPLVTKEAPKVEKTEGDTAYTVTFSQYMDISSINATNVTVKNGGKAVETNITPVNKEAGADGKTYYASVFKIEPKNAIVGKVTLSINNVKNYAGIALKDAYTYSVDLPVTVKFVSDGKTISEKTYKEGEAIVKPADPEKEGYTFKGWNPEVLANTPAKNMTFTAVFEKIPDIDIKGYQKKLDVDYKSTLIFHTTIDAPEGYEIVWQNGTKGSTLTLNQVKDKEIKVQAKLVRISDGKTVKTTQEETVNVNTGFFAKIIAFFRGLFKSLPVYEDNIKRKK